MNLGFIRARGGTLPMLAAAPPREAQATAALADFPPGDRSSPVPNTVSPTCDGIIKKILFLQVGMFFPTFCLERIAFPGVLQTLHMKKKCDKSSELKFDTFACYSRGKKAPLEKSFFFTREIFFRSIARSHTLFCGHFFFHKFIEKKRNPQTDKKR